jgi:hypothetical protein
LQGKQVFHKKLLGRSAQPKLARARFQSPE